MWKITTLLCLLLGATIPLSLIDSSHATGLTGLLASLLLCATLLIIPAGEIAFLQQTTLTALLIAAVLPIWMVIQVLPLPPLAHPAWRTASESLGLPIAGRISIDPEATIETILGYVAACAVVLVAAASAIDRRRARRIMIILAATPVGGMIVADVRTHWFAPVKAIASLTGSMAVSAIIGTAVGIAAAIEAWEEGRAKSRSTSPSIETWYFVAAAVAVAGLTQMAGGIELALATTLPIGVILFVWICRRLAATPGVTALLASALLAIGAATAVASIHDRAIPAVIAFASAPADEIAVVQAMLNDAPLAGIGAGASASLLPTYTLLQNSMRDQVPVTAAAAIYVGLGPVFFWPTIVVLIGLIINLITGAIRRGRDWSFCAASAGAILGLLVMAFCLPFSLSTPTLCLLATLLGASLAQSVTRSRPGVV